MHLPRCPLATGTSAAVLRLKANNHRLRRPPAASPLVDETLPPAPAARVHRDTDHLDIPALSPAWILMHDGLTVTAAHTTCTCSFPSRCMPPCPCSCCALSRGGAYGSCRVPVHHLPWRLTCHRGYAVVVGGVALQSYINEHHGACEERKRIRKERYDRDPCTCRFRSRVERADPSSSQPAMIDGYSDGPMRTFQHPSSPPPPKTAGGARVLPPRRIKTLL